MFLSSNHLMGLAGLAADEVGHGRIEPLAILATMLLDEAVDANTHVNFIELGQTYLEATVESRKAKLVDLCNCQLTQNYVPSTTDLLEVSFFSG
jgi:hypothetical protein